MHPWFFSYLMCKAYFTRDFSKHFLFYITMKQMCSYLKLKTFVCAQNWPHVDSFIMFFSIFRSEMYFIDEILNGLHRISPEYARLAWKDLGTILKKTLSSILFILIAKLYIDILRKILMQMIKLLKLIFLYKLHTLPFCDVCCYICYFKYQTLLIML